VDELTRTLRLGSSQFPDVRPHSYAVYIRDPSSTLSVLHAFLSRMAECAVLLRADECEKLSPSIKFQRPGNHNAFSDILRTLFG
jgi:hypothetical protein